MKDDPSLSVFSKTFGRYQVLEKIGEGGIGQVFKAYDPQLKRTVALKILRQQDSLSAQKRFSMEAMITAKLRHPNIVSLYEFGEDEGTSFFTMEYVEGARSLDKIVPDRPPIAEVLVLVIKIARALEYAHSEGVVHRDLKPSNILLCDREPKVMDFGLAKSLDQSIPLSSDGMILGTPLYMPPEQALGNIRQIDGRSDIYSLGCVLYELLAGRPPFFAGTHPQLLKKIVHTRPIPPGQARRCVPSSLDAICLKALEKKKEARYRTMSEFAEDLEMVLQNKRPKASSTFFGRPWSRVFFIVLPLIVLVVFWALWLSHERWPIVLRLDVPERTFRYRLVPLVITVENLGSTTVDSVQARILLSKGLAGHRIHEERFDLPGRRSQSLTCLVYGDRPGESICEVFLMVQGKTVCKISKKIAVDPSRYGLPPETLRSSMSKDGSILDMTSGYWQSLSTEEQRRHATWYQQGYALQMRHDLEKTVYRNGAAIDFILIPPGRFWMGIDDDKARHIALHDPSGTWDISRPRHEVTITKPYYLSKHEITQEQWESVMPANDSFFQNQKLPVTNVDWRQCHEFCVKLRFRLPSEAEWEYACRAGSTSMCPWGTNRQTTSANTASYWKKEETWSVRSLDSNFKKTWAYRAKMTAGGTFPANAFGLYDMIGNASEWCHDFCRAYSSDSRTDPIFTDPLEIDGVLRGGSWWSPILSATCSCRKIFPKTGSEVDTGFRAALDVGSEY